MVLKANCKNKLLIWVEYIFNRRITFLLFLNRTQNFKEDWIVLVESLCIVMNKFIGFFVSFFKSFYPWLVFKTLFQDEVFRDCLRLWNLCKLSLKQAFIVLIIFTIAQLFCNFDYFCTRFFSRFLQLLFVKSLHICLVLLNFFSPFWHKTIENLLSSQRLCIAFEVSSHEFLSKQSRKWSEIFLSEWYWDKLFFLIFNIHCLLMMLQQAPNIKLKRKYIYGW